MEVTSKSTKEVRYDFEITYKINKDDDESFFPFQFSYITYPDELRNVITQNEYQSIVELLSIQGEPHNYIYRDLILVFSFSLLLPSIIIVTTTIPDSIVSYMLVFLLVFILFLIPFLAFEIYKLISKRRSIIAELEKRRVKLNFSFKLKLFYVFYVTNLFIQSLICMGWAQIKFLNGTSEIIDQYSILETFIYVFIVIDIIAIIYYTYNFMLFTKYRYLVTNTTQSEHLTTLTENIKKIEVPFSYLSYNI